MSEDSTRAMEHALQAAVLRMNNGGSAIEPSVVGPDALKMLMTVVGKLMERNDDREDIGEKLEELQSQDLGELRSQVVVVRKQLRALLSSQQELLKTQRDLISELRELRTAQEQQALAFVELAEQMAHVEILDSSTFEPAPRPRASRARMPLDFGESTNDGRRVRPRPAKD